MISTGVLIDRLTTEMLSSFMLFERVAVISSDTPWNGHETPE